MFNLPSNSWKVNNNDPINSFSHDQYYSHNFQKPFPNQQEYQYNYTLNSKQEVSHHLDHPKYHSCTDQPLSFPNAYTSPSEDQNLLPQNSHGINVSQKFYSQPSFVKESAEKISDVLLPSKTFTPTITGSKLVKSDSDRSGEDLSESVAPTDQYDQPQILRKTSGGGCGDSGNNKSKKRKDRHSKIHTGTTLPRHRRMRLSIDVAREFFDLQELLGFERASKTVEWLLRKARSEIKKLKDSNNEGGYSSTCPEMQTPSPNSESCEGASGLDEVGINGEDQGVAGGSSSKPLVKERKKYSRSNSKRIAINPLAKELREKAKERARERTRDKMSNRVERVEPAVQNHRGSGGGVGGGSSTKIANHNKDPDDHGLKINQPASNKSEEKQQTGDQLPNQNMMDIDMNNNIGTPNSSLGAVMQVSRYGQRYEFSQEILPISNPNDWNIVQVSNHDHILETSTTSTSATAPIVDYETYSYLVNHLEKWNNSLVANSVSNVGTTSGATGFGVPQQSFLQASYIFKHHGRIQGKKKRYHGRRVYFYACFPHLNK